ncbi:MAG: hypothetical protein M3O50_17240 [Myxococcota bacterium]|nr:hypothetical protein [Myxococcota bacterium]
MTVTPIGCQTVLRAKRGGSPSVSVFAAEHGLDPQRIYPLATAARRSEHTTFRELIVRTDARHGDAKVTAFEIALASGAVVRVPQSFNGAALAGLLEVLAQVRAC